MTWGEMNYLPDNGDGEKYRALIGIKKGSIGIMVHRLSWGGIVLLFPDGIKITYTTSDVEKCSAETAE
jgi:hypothetical protein